MERKSSNEQSSDPEYLAFEIERNPDGLYVDTSTGDLWTFRRDLDAYEDGENVWTPDLDDTPSVIISALEYRGYTIRDEE
ncbi:hypothetical protein [Haloarcula rubripromontorii]|uniref:hypothetical protein n=1 Tax=Haloarcula rubripromontorii TaxID=1705562 RepID=UPI00345C3D7B